jgi:hypothetical protein
MTIEERTERYITRRVAELRGERSPSLMDEVTTKYIARRMAELRGISVCRRSHKDDVYISRRIAYLGATGR